MSADAQLQTKSDVITGQKFGPVYSILADAIAARAFPGCAFGVFAGGSVVLQDALGQFIYDEAAPGVKPDTVYDIASLTKVVATTATGMLLHQRGALDLETPLGELLPGFVVGRPPSEHARLITLRHLLAHSSGLPGYAEIFKSAASPDAVYRACLQQPIEAEPGTRAEYSDIGFILLGKALEVIARQSLAAFTRNELFSPLGLVATRFDPSSQDRILIPPTEEDRTFRCRRIQGEVQDENAWRLQGVAGHAGLFSNVPDLLNFAYEILAAHRGDGVGDRSPIFTRETVEYFAQRQGPAGSSRALGWDTPSANSSAGKDFSPHSIGHLGYSGCSLWIDLEAQVAAVLLTNRTWPDRQSQLIKQIRPAFHDALRRALTESN